jgi:hypothetical protein
MASSGMSGMVLSDLILGLPRHLDLTPFCQPFLVIFSGAIDVPV